MHFGLPASPPGPAPVRHMSAAIQALSLETRCRRSIEVARAFATARMGSASESWSHPWSRGSRSCRSSPKPRCNRGPPMARRSGRTRPVLCGDRGQAPLELIAGLPALVLAGVVGLQLLAAGYTLTLADGAVEAGAAALVAGRAATPAVHRALPGWARGRTTVEVSGGRVRVTLRPPSLLRSVSQRLAVSSSAWVRQSRPDSS
jgi:hypothetical protein